MMTHYVKCEEGIFYIVLRSVHEYMFCGSITDSWYQEMPPTWIELDKETLRKTIVPLKDHPIEDCEAKIEMISDNSFCLRVYKFNCDLGCEDDIIPFKIDPKNFLETLRDNIEALRDQ